MSEKAASIQVTYDDLSSRRFLWATMIWGIVGMAVGALCALQLAWWPANGGQAWHHTLDHRRARNAARQGCC